MMTIETFPARWWAREGARVRCSLCPHQCLVDEGDRGLCGVREVAEGRLISTNYGKVAVSQLDAIEKKPMFHFQPGSRLLSVGSTGCNLHCGYCQNLMLSHPDGEVPTRHLTPAGLVLEAKDRGASGIAFTFNEPTVWSEYVLDVAGEAHRKGLFVMVNTNGYISAGPGDDLLEGIDALKVDIKGFDDGTYRRTCGGKLAPVLDFCARSMRSGRHLELSYLMIPQVTDSPDHLSRFFRWVMDHLGPDVPLHLFRFQPSGGMAHLGPEPVDRILEASDMAAAMGLRYVYLGGEGGPGLRDTYCPRCRRPVIIRSAEGAEPVVVQGERVSRFCPSYSKVENRLQGSSCPNCGETVPVRYWP